MTSAAGRPVCPLCGEPTSLEVAYCQRCQFRLPWADELEGKPQTTLGTDKKDSRWETVFERTLRKWGLLKAETVVCRYCNEIIDADARQCPHCHSWLVVTKYYQGVDPWTTGHRDEDVARVNILGKNAGCFSVIPLLICVVILWFWR